MQHIKPYLFVQYAVVALLNAVGIPVTKVAPVIKLHADCNYAAVIMYKGCMLNQSADYKGYSLRLVSLLQLQNTRQCWQSTL